MSVVCSGHFWRDILPEDIHGATSDLSVTNLWVWLTAYEGHMCGSHRNIISTRRLLLTLILISHPVFILASYYNRHFTAHTEHILHEHVLNNTIWYIFWYIFGIIFDHGFNTNITVCNSLITLYIKVIVQ